MSPSMEMDSPISASAPAVGSPASSVHSQQQGQSQPGTSAQPQQQPPSSSQPNSILPPPPAPSSTSAATPVRRRRSSAQASHGGRNSSEHGDEVNSSDEEGGKHDRAEHESLPGDENGRKRRRIDSISSCETCKQRKVKCDRAQPSCGWCARNGQECIYRQKKKPGLRAGIGRELEERLDRVESMLASHSRILESHLTGGVSAVGSSCQPFPSPSTASHHLSPPPSLSHLGPSSLPPPHHPQPVAGGSNSNGFSANTIFRERGNREMADLSTSHSFDPDLPTDDILCTMIDLFFQHIYPVFPILHRQTLLDSFFQRRPSEVDEADIILMHAMVAAALRFSRDRRMDEAWKERFRALAKRKVIFYALENPSVQSLRAIVIIVLDVVGSTNGPSGWGLLALTTRMALHLGLAVEPAREPHPQISTMGVGTLPDPKDWIEEEGRRRLFWVIYFLDVVTTLGTSLDLTLDETEIERQLPCRDNLWDRNQHINTRWFRSPKRNEQAVNNVESLSAFSYQMEVVGILGRIHRFLRETVDINVLADVESWQLKYRTLDKALTAWKYSLPMSFGNLTRALNIGGSAVDPSWVMLHAIYNTAVIRLHSSAAYPTTRSTLFSPSYSAGQRCLSAVENIAALTRLALSASMLPLLGSTFAFTVWVAARLLLVHASTSPPSPSPAPDIPDVRLFLDALREMAKLWPTAERYCSIIQRVVDELLVSQGSPGSGAPEDGRSCVGILADMRMTAYGVDVMISRQPDLRVLHHASAMDGLGLGGMEGGEGVPGLDYVDLFGWFNFPRVAGAGGEVGLGIPSLNGTPGDEHADWLFQEVAKVRKLRMKEVCKAVEIVEADGIMLDALEGIGSVLEGVDVDDLDITIRGG